MESKGKGKRERETAEEKDELKEIQKLQGHAGMVFCIAWNPASGTNGEPALLASCGVDKTLRLWTQNPQTSAFECSRTFEGAHAGTGRFFSWSPEGRFLAIPSYDGTTYIWDKNEDEVHDMEDLDLEEDDKEEVLSVSWDHSGCYLATCSRAAVRIWETLLLPHCESDKAHSSKGFSISFNATGDKMVTSREDLSIKVWGPEGKLSGDSGREYVSCEGIIASGAADGAIRLFVENQDGLLEIPFVAGIL
ncbi:protein CIA1 [Daucus carota subsp. sativus]|uniref:protein CIA1 n=1 Tax=Daucus carota subsp. sativus TaxID=79200 RepID=UPI003083B32B